MKQTETNRHKATNKQKRRETNKILKRNKQNGHKEIQHIINQANKNKKSDR